MCFCNCRKIRTEYSTICVGCGSEVSYLKCDTYNVYSAPITKNYSRSHRFRQKVKKLLLIDSAPRFSDQVWKYLECNRGELSCVKEIRKKLRQATHIKQKHYDSVRLFHTVFCKEDASVVVENPYELLNIIMSEFEDVYMKWAKRFTDGLFFSSDWLLRRIVLKTCPELMHFLKPATSISRNNKYEQMIQTISNS
jgi:hypothetical protein